MLLSWIDTLVLTLERRSDIVPLHKNFFNMSVRTRGTTLTALNKPDTQLSVVLDVYLTLHSTKQ